MEYLCISETQQKFRQSKPGSGPLSPDREYTNQFEDQQAKQE